VKKSSQIGVFRKKRFFCKKKSGFSALFSEVKKTRFFAISAFQLSIVCKKKYKFRVFLAKRLSDYWKKKLKSRVNLSVPEIDKSGRKPVKKSVASGDPFFDIFFCRKIVKNLHFFSSPW
jgi:hypothetical protein